MANPLEELFEAGQSVWYDAIRRAMIPADFERMIEGDKLRGVTSNPAIFEKAFTGSDDYHTALRDHGAAGEADPAGVYETLAIEDIRATADVFRPVFEQSEGVDGYVSLEVSPHLARDTAGTLADARRLWQAVDRPNLMIKVPGTPEGLPAVEQLIADGVNVNVTLLFSRAVYADVAEAYLRGLERRKDTGGPLSTVASVASFFISRIDSAVDKAIAVKMESCEHGAEARQLRELVGKVAIANAKQAFAHFRQVMADPRWDTLSADGARPQRLLWASTSTKNPDLPDAYYVEALIGSDTVNTIPPATYQAFREHGRVAPTLESGTDEAQSMLDQLEQLDIDLNRITDDLLEEGIVLFADAYDRLLDSVARASRVAANA